MVCNLYNLLVNFDSIMAVYAQRSTNLLPPDTEEVNQLKHMQLAGLFGQWVALRDPTRASLKNTKSLLHAKQTVSRKQFEKLQHLYIN